MSPSSRQEDGAADVLSGFRPQNSSQLFDYKWILMNVPPVLPAKPVPDICYRGAGIQRNGQGARGPGCQGWPCGSFRGGEKTLDSRLRLSPTVVIGEPAGMTEGRGCGNDRRRSAGRTGGAGLGVGRCVCLRGEEKRPWIPAYNRREGQKERRPAGRTEGEETGGKDGGVRREGRGGGGGKDEGGRRE